MVKNDDKINDDNEVMDRADDNNDVDKLISDLEELAAKEDELIDPYRCLIAAQSDVGTVIKDGKNDFLSNEYATLEAVQNIVLPVFRMHGFAVLQSGGADEHGKYMSTILVHASGHKFESKIYLIHSKQDMQSLGSAITYARRYGLLAMSGVQAVDDDANEAVGKEELYKKVMLQAKGILTFLENKDVSEYDMASKKAKADVILDHLLVCSPALNAELRAKWDEVEKRLKMERE